MATLSTTTPLKPGAFAAGPRRGSFALASTDAILAVVAAWRRRRTYRALAALDDRMLKDIGLSRGGIEAAARTGRLPEYKPRF